MPTCAVCCRLPARDRAVLLLLDTGLRVSELVGIRLGDLRPDGSIKLLGKGAAERSVPVGGEARRAIGQYLAQRGPGTAGQRLFLNQADQALTTSGVSQLLRRLRRRTDVALSDVDLAGRHRAASPADRLLRRGPLANSRPPAQLAGWSGASGGPGSGAQSRRSTGETLRWTARRSSSRSR